MCVCVCVCVCVRYARYPSAPIQASNAPSIHMQCTDGNKQPPYLWCKKERKKESGRLEALDRLDPVPPVWLLRVYIWSVPPPACLYCSLSPCVSVISRLFDHKQKTSFFVCK